jgi:methionyl-tRNA formyltransferase|tara:strand:+ start:1294 stop:2325 length:1032 start_codon:yes stop_codon:yes gene_type:complete
MLLGIKILLKADSCEMKNLNERQIAFAGNGTPIARLIDFALTLKGINVKTVFVATDELDFFRRRYEKHPLLSIEDIKHIEKGVPKGRNWKTVYDYLISFNNKHLIGNDVLRNIRIGGINFHAGALPEYAGSYTYQWAIRNDEHTFTSTIHWIEGKTDSGPVICKKEFPISPSETGLSLLMRSVDAALELMYIVLTGIGTGRVLPRISQDLSKRCFYSMSKICESGMIEWDKTAEEVERLIRAADFSPLSSPTYEPYTYSPVGVLKVHKAKVGSQSPGVNAGEVVYIDNECVVVKTGCEKNLVITSLTINDKRFKKGEILETKLNVGDCFEANEPTIQGTQICE